MKEKGQREGAQPLPISSPTLIYRKNTTSETLISTAFQKYFVNLKK